MSLTAQDLAAIKKIVDDRIDATEVLMGEGFAEVYKHIEVVKKDLSSVKQDVLTLRYDVGSLELAVGRIEALHNA